MRHENPYTKLRYTDDPAVALVEINNENAIDIGYHAPSPFYWQELTGIYNAWLAKYRTAEQIATLRDLADVKGDNALVPLMQGRQQAAKAPLARFYAEAKFYNELQRDYFTGTENYSTHSLFSYRTSFCFVRNQAGHQTIYVIPYLPSHRPSSSSSAAQRRCWLHKGRGLHSQMSA